MLKYSYVFLLFPVVAFGQQSASSTSSTIANILLWVAILGGIFWLFYISDKKDKQRQEYARNIEMQYKESLKGNDKALALELGRKYYSLKRRGGVLTIYDEQALTNDLSTMQ